MKQNISTNNHGLTTKKDLMVLHPEKLDFLI